jgi:hypothetical protein
MLRSPLARSKERYERTKSAPTPTGSSRSELLLRLARALSKTTLSDHIRDLRSSPPLPAPQSPTRITSPSFTPPLPYMEALRRWLRPPVGVAAAPRLAPKNPKPLSKPISKTIKQSGSAKVQPTDAFVADFIRSRVRIKNLKSGSSTLDTLIRHMDPKSGKAPLKDRERFWKALTSHVSKSSGGRAATDSKSLSQSLNHLKTFYPTE